MFFAVVPLLQAWLISSKFPEESVSREVDGPMISWGLDPYTSMAVAIATFNVAFFSWLSSSRVMHVPNRAFRYCDIAWWRQLMSCWLMDAENLSVLTLSTFISYYGKRTYVVYGWPLLVINSLTLLNLCQIRLLYSLFLDIALAVAINARGRPFTIFCMFPIQIIWYLGSHRQWSNECNIWLHAVTNSGHLQQPWPLDQSSFWTQC